jgi:hypothetical protein
MAKKTLAAPSTPSNIELPDNVAAWCLVHDMIEETENDRPGGWDRAEVSKMHDFENRILADHSANWVAVAWKRKLLARAIENGWDPENIEPVLRSLAADSGAVFAEQSAAPADPIPTPSDARQALNLRPTLGYTIKEAVEVSGISRSVLYEEMRSGALIARKRGRSLIILRGELESYLAGLPAYRPESAGA